jgi:uncharacterized protein (DUF2147 family)
LTFAALAADPTGSWLYQGMTVSVTNCGGLCATIVALREPNDSRTGKPKTDSQNANASKRNRPLVGVQIFTGMQPQGANKWTGRLYNYEDGKSYDASVFLEGANTLKMQGCVLFVCQTRTMTRKN